MTTGQVDHKYGNLVSVSWSDHLIFGEGDGRLDSPAAVRRRMQKWRAELGAGTILWRCTRDKIKGRYQQALNLKNRDQLAEALSAFQAIAVDQPYYKDVTIQIQEIERLQLLAGQLAQAQTAYESQDWMQAVAAFETLRAINADYDKELVEERLYQSYLNAAEEVLADPQADLEALETAEAFFRRALTLRPQAQEVQIKRFVY